MRIVKEHSFKRGLNDIAVEAKDEATLDRLITKINAAGWEKEWSMCGQDCDYGYATEYAIPHDQFEHFNKAYKKAKAELIAEIKAEQVVLVEPTSIMALQQEYSDTVNACSSNHAGRVRGGAAKAFISALHKQGFDYEQIAQAFKDADEMMILERETERDLRDLTVWEHADHYCREIGVTNVPSIEDRQAARMSMSR